MCVHRTERQKSQKILRLTGSLLSRDLRSHRGHALKLTFFPPLLPVFSSSTLILHPSFSGTDVEVLLDFSINNAFS